MVTVVNSGILTGDLKRQAEIMVSDPDLPLLNHTLDNKYFVIIENKIIAGFI